VQKDKLKFKILSVTLIAFLSLVGFGDISHAANWSGIIDPSRAIDWSNAGVVGGIPNRTTICVTLNPGATSAQINDAIANCDNGVVYLSAGTYTISSGVTFRGYSNVTLRGAGPDKTFLVFSGADGCGGLYADICVINGSGYWAGGTQTQPGRSNSAAWTAGYAKGTTQITLDNVSGLSPGSMVILDQLDDSSDNGNVFACQTSGVCATEGPGGQGRTNRAQEQYVQVMAVNGNQVTISPGLYMSNWRSSQSPGAWWTGPQAESDGVEDLSMDHTNTNGLSGTYFFNAHNCWLKNVKSINANRNHVWFYLSSHVQVQDSYFYGTQHAQSQSYGVESFGGGDNLVQNNIFQHIAGAMINDNTEGNVYAYNYAVDDYYVIGNTIGWQQASSYYHAAGNAYTLNEGNDGIGLTADDIHGTTDLVTAFRNYWNGRDPAGGSSGGKFMQTSSVILNAFNRYFNFIGNVLGTIGYHDTYQDLTPSGTSADTSIYTLGWSGNEGSTASNVPDDALVKTTLFRWGNYDTVTGAARWNVSEVPSGLSQYANPVPADNNLPSSLYLTGKPSWWPSSIPWPAIGPDITGGNVSDLAGHVYKIPAHVCYDNDTKDTNGILTDFNADICYGNGSSSDTTPPAAPTGIQVN
jgi:hypothetical protein